MEPGATAAEVEGEVLEPFQLADLLGVDRADIGLWTAAAVRLPAGWADKWRRRTGPLELTPAEVARLIGRVTKTVLNWCRPTPTRPVLLASRKAGPWERRIAPAAVTACLKRMAGGAAPAVPETPLQQARRAKADQAEAAALCGSGRKRKAA